MAISWQTGEPPCGVELLVEYVYDDDVTGSGGKPVRDVYRYLGHDDLASITILRWSTLDDDRAAKAMGALEKMLSDETSWPWVCLEKTVCNDSYEATRYDDDGNERKVSATSLIEAIEKLTENGNDSR